MPQLLHLFHADPLGAIMLGLIAVVAWLIFAFSRVYLRGEARLGRHFVLFVVTVVTAAAVAIADNLILLTICWSLSGLAMQQLLLFYPHRPFAKVAARKKFLLSRVADIAMIGCMVELWDVFHTLSLRSIAVLSATIPPGDGHVKVAALCVVLAAAIRCAQIPFHGWILQVMEAPTPVSALLHAGVVNIGGFVLLRLAPIIERTNSARDALILIGGITAITAALVMTTRVSIKLSLAWSTCAQMGCMLVEAGVGAYPLLLLHLVGHSLYKSYAFLHAGHTVEHTRIAAQSPRLQRPQWHRSRIVRVGFVFVFAGCGWYGGLALMHEPALALGMLLMSLAIMQLLTLGAGDRSVAPALFLGAAVMFVMYGFGERLAQMAILPAAMPASHMQCLLAAAAFIILALLQAVIVDAPDSRLARKIYPHAYAEFRLDDYVSRIMLRRLSLSPRENR